MPRGPSCRCPKTGLLINQVETLVFDQARARGLEVTHIHTATWIAAGLPEGKKPNVTRVRDRMALDPDFPGEFFRDDDGRIKAIIGLPNSLHVWGVSDRAQRQVNMISGKKLPLAGSTGGGTDPTSGQAL